MKWEKTHCWKTRSLRVSCRRGHASLVTSLLKLQARVSIYASPVSLSMKQTREGCRLMRDEALFRFQAAQSVMTYECSSRWEAAWILCSSTSQQHRSTTC